MDDSAASPSPSSNVLIASPSTPPPAPPPPPEPFVLPPPETFKPAPDGRFLSFRRPPVRVTSEYDSDSGNFFHKVSCKFVDNLAKLRLTFQNDRNGAVSTPQLGFVTKNLSVLYDFDTRNALVRGSFDVGNRLHFRASRDLKEEQGEVAMVTHLGDPSYKLELLSSLPAAGLPRVALGFPLGEVTLEKRDGELANPLSINGIFKSQVMNGILTAAGGDEELRLRYSYKDEEMTFVPSISLPSKAVSFAFKRRFNPTDKFSYWYHFNTNDWSAVYKRAISKELKFKAGYDSDVRLGWASLWVGEELGKTKAAPMKTKAQLMLQVPQDDLGNAVFLFRLKKRWDF